MVRASQRTSVRGSTFIRLLARLADVEVSPSSQPLSDRLSQWLDWNHAIALSTALDGEPPAAASEPATSPGVADDEYLRVRSALAKAVAGDLESPTVMHRRAGQISASHDGANEVADFAFFRQRYLARQRAMQSAAGNLRGRLRDMLAGQSADMARLAEVDAAMELALSPREQMLLAGVPALLGKHYEWLRQAQTMPADAHVSAFRAAATHEAWLDVFRKDMQSVLLAELDVRFQPVEGLLEALRTCQQGHHV